MFNYSTTENKNITTIILLGQKRRVFPATESRMKKKKKEYKIDIKKIKNTQYT